MKISAEGQKNSIRITNDQSQYWSDKSKGYAEDAKKSATEAKGYADAASASVIEANNIVKDFDAHVVTKTNEFDEHTVAKQEEFDTHASVKQNDFDVNAANVTARFDNNYLDKTKDFNTNATNKTSAFDSNATLKTNAFNNNATAKTAIIDSKIEQAELAETNANIWAEGSDAQVRTLGGEHSAKGWNGVVSQTANAGVSSINNSTKDGVDLLNRTATNIAKEKYNNSAKGYLTGEVSTDEIMVNQLIDMKHSTFDKSKFTVVGSPTITNDGVASGFSMLNKIKVEKTFEVQNKYKIASPIYYLTEYPNYAERLMISTVFDIHYTRSTQSLLLGGATFKVDIPLNTPFQFIIENNTAYYYIDGVKGETKPITPLTSFGSFTIGAYNNTILERTFKGSIDLKQFSISVDGKEVFSGNKTGIDVIKKDNFTKVGSPTITNDGILNTNTSSVIYKQVNNIFGKKNVIKFKFKYQKTESLYQQPFTIRSGETGDYFLLFFIRNQDNIFLWQTKQGIHYWDAIHLVEGKEYEVTVETDFNSYVTCKFGDNERTSSGIFYEFGNRINICIGNAKINQFTNPMLNLDLNAFKIYVDGNLVYQPLLRIPYTKSSTGSKVVDSIYRDRVEDVYEQYGNALYYTLDETKKDCTLPMGELYGLIGERRLVSCTRTDETFLEVYSDGTVVQGGKCTANTLVNLSRVYEGDKTYNLTVPYSAKNKSSFTPTVTGDWIAYGKGEL